MPPKPKHGVKQSPELRSLYQKASALAGDGQIMVQELIPGGGTQQFSYCAFFRGSERRWGRWWCGAGGNIRWSSDGPVPLSRRWTCRSWRSYPNAFCGR